MVNKNGSVRPILSMSPYPVKQAGGFKNDFNPPALLEHLLSLVSNLTLHLCSVSLLSYAVASLTIFGLVGV